MKSLKLFYAFIPLLCSACSNTSIEGEWIQQVPNMPNVTQGIKIEKNGEAKSINMNTLEYERWEKIGEKLILSGKSIGNGTTCSFSDTLTIVSLTPNELSLKKNQLVIKYNKKN
ncbi:MAG: lipocalin family protein [Bacteroidaceae bacterium]|nr:lipocalin family protein [Bacteroidaceae bacterium]